MSDIVETEWFKRKVRDEGRQLSRTEWFLARTYGPRKGNGAAFDACEFGYHCPEGHYPVTWSEFNDHVWCAVCKVDILSKKCPLRRPTWMTQKQFTEFVGGLPFIPKILDGTVEVPA